MGTQKTLVKALGGMLVGGMLLSGGMVYAQAPGTSIGGSYGKTPIVDFQISGVKGHPRAGCKVFQQNLDQLVKDGAITQEKAAKIRAFMNNRMKEKQARREQWKNLSPEERNALKEKWKKDKAGRGHGDLFSDLVKNNIITQQEADLIKAKMKEKVSQQHQ